MPVIAMTLTGILDNASEESDALEMVEAVPGVARIDSQLRSATLPRYKLET